MSGFDPMNFFRTPREKMLATQRYVADTNAAAKMGAQGIASAASLQNRQLQNEGQLANTGLRNQGSQADIGLRNQGNINAMRHKNIADLSTQDQQNRFTMKNSTLNRQNNLDIAKIRNNEEDSDYSQATVAKRAMLYTVKEVDEFGKLIPGTGLSPNEASKKAAMETRLMLELQKRQKTMNDPIFMDYTK